MSNLTGLELLSSYLESGYLFVIVAIALQILYAFVVDDGSRRRTCPPPPGPWGLPFVGFYPFLGKDPYKTLGQLDRQYGDIVMLPIGNQKMVILNSHVTVKEALVKYGDTFSFRSKDALHNTRLVFDSNGLYCESGETYKELRSFVMSTLKDFGMGTTASEKWITGHCESAVDRISSLDEAAFDTTQFRTQMATKMMFQFLMNKNYDYDDPKFAHICGQLHGLENFVERFSPIDVMPWFSIFPDWLNGIRKLRRDKTEFYENLREIIDEHERTFDENRVRDFVDSFLVRMYQRRREQQGSGPFRDKVYNLEQLASTLTVLLIAGYSTSVHILQSLFEALVTKPEIQDRIRQEVDNVIGCERQPSYLDKLNMPYTEAAILEAQRYSNPLPFGTVRSNSEPVTIMGYAIPKGSLVMGNYGKLNRDPEYWSRPTEFFPEHFLDENGRVTHPDHFMPFGAGKRNCPGQNLAKMELFLILTTLIQRFIIKLPTEANRKCDQQNRKCTTYDMAPFQVVATKRIRFY